MFLLQDNFVHLLNRNHYTPDDVRALRVFLDEHGTFDFPILETGLFSAACLPETADYTGYDNVWVRDNIHIAHAHLVTGHTGVACRTAKALLHYFRKHRRRFEKIVTGSVDPSDPMNRPHVRFNGQTLEEIPERWSHAQNDALGYFLWFYCKLARANIVDLHSDDWQLLALFALYFRAIQYWQDEDSGHWEEARKIEASSIGTVVAGLREFRRLMVDLSQDRIQFGQEYITVDALDELLDMGRAALNQILPLECVQPDKHKHRRYDAALLFLIYPLHVVNDNMADTILDQVESNLLGEHGVRRYLGDSFWCADYKELLQPELRTNDVSSDMSARDSLLQRGQEAQWCIFDPVLSTIYGRRYRATGDGAFLRKQVHHLNRSLDQLTSPSSGFPEFRCPELYYIERGKYVPNDVTPLLWTQANLTVALNHLERSAEKPENLPREWSLSAP